MPIRRVTTLRKRLDNPEASCGREIPTVRAGRSKRVWWARGPALDTFESRIEADIEDALRNIGLGYADIYIRLYMIGSRQDTAGPIIMVCCTNAEVRSDAETAIRRSDIPKTYPQYGIGASALPLEQPTPARSLAGEVDLETVYPEPPRYPGDSSSFLSYPARPQESTMTQPGVELQHESDIFSKDKFPRVGRSLLLAERANIPQRCATGGVVIQVGDSYFQLTVDHIVDNHALAPNLLSQDDLDECHFDGQDEEDEDVPFEFDFEVTHRGSLTPAEREASWTESANEDADMSQPSMSSCMSPSETRSLFSPGPRHQAAATPVIAQQAFQRVPVLSFQAPAGSIQRVGALSLPSREGYNPGLDYVLVSVDVQNITGVNEIVLPKGGFHKTLSITRAVPTKSEETRIIAVTATSGAIPGVLLPSAIHFRRTTEAAFQRLHAVQLERVVVEGDCGAVVVDESTGDLYGHIVMGCSNTQLAYIVRATEVLEDIRTRAGTDIRIVFGDGKQQPIMPVPDDSLIAPALLPQPPTVPSPDISLNETDRPVLPLDWAAIPHTSAMPSTSDYLASYGATSYAEPLDNFLSFDFDDHRPMGFVDPTLINHDARSDPSHLRPDIHMSYPTPEYSPATFSGSPIASMRVGSASPYMMGPTSFPAYSPFGPPEGYRKPSIVPFQSCYSVDESKEKERCPHPDCGRVFKDLKAHMLTHQNERPEKCPITTCEYHLKGFARKYDKNRHTLTHYKGTMVCSFCPGSGSADAKSFNRADVFKRHLTAVHGVEQTPPNSRKKRNAGSGSLARSQPTEPRATGKCTMCEKTFANAQEFYEHLDNCILGIIQSEDPSQVPEGDPQRSSVRPGGESGDAEEDSADGEGDIASDDDEQASGSHAKRRRGRQEPTYGRGAAGASATWKRRGGKDSSRYPY